MKKFVNAHASFTQLNNAYYFGVGNRPDTKNKRLEGLNCCSSVTSKKRGFRQSYLALCHELVETKLHQTSSSFKHFWAGNSAKKLSTSEGLRKKMKKMLNSWSTKLCTSRWEASKKSLSGQSSLSQTGLSIIVGRFGASQLSSKSGCPKNWQAEYKGRQNLHLKKMEWTFAEEKLLQGTQAQYFLRKPS